MSAAWFPVVVLSGARQTGKSTLVKALETAAARRYITLDTSVSRGLAAAEPQTLLDSADTRPRLRSTDSLMALQDMLDFNIAAEAQNPRLRWIAARLRRQRLAERS